MKIKLLAILGFLLAGSSVQAQNFNYDWHELGTIQSDYSPYTSLNKIVDDTLYVIYEFYGDSVDADPTNSVDWISDEDLINNSKVIYITKFTLDGDYITSLKLIEEPNGNIGISAFDVSSNGKIVLLSTLYYNPLGIDLDPTAGTVGTYSLTTPGEYAGSVLFYETSGNYIGHLEYLFAGPWMGYTQGFYPGGLAIDENNQLFIVGSFYGTTDFDFTAATDNKTSVGISDIAIMKIDLISQTYLWTKAIGSDDYDSAERIEFKNNALCVVGRFRGGTIDMDPGAGVTNETKPVNSFDWLFLLKLDADGAFVNSLAFGAATNDTDPYDFGIDEQNNIYLSGSAGMGEIIDVDPSASTHLISIPNNYNNFIIKYDSNFDLIWEKTFTANSNLDLSYSSGLVVADSYVAMVLSANSGDVNVANSTSSSVLISPTSYESVIIGMNKNDGVISDTIRFKTDPASAYSYGEIYSIAIDDNQNIYGIGALEGMMDFNPFDGMVIFDTTYQESLPYYDQNNFNFRLNWNGFAELEEPGSDNVFTVYPNPTTSNFTIQSDKVISQIQILDISGKIVFSESNIDENMVQIDASKFESGVYFIQVIDANKEFTSYKLIKN